MGRDRDRAGKRVPRPKRRRYTPRGRARAQGSRRRCARGRGRGRLLPSRSASRRRFRDVSLSSTLSRNSRKTHTTDVSRPPFPLARRIARRRVRRAHARLTVPDALGVRARGRGPSNTGRHRGRHAVARRSRRRASPRTRLFFGNFSKRDQAVSIRDTRVSPGTSPRFRVAKRTSSRRGLRSGGGSSPGQTSSARCGASDPRRGAPREWEKYVKTRVREAARRDGAAKLSRRSGSIWTRGPWCRRARFS